VVEDIEHNDNDGDSDEVWHEMTRRLDVFIPSPDSR